MENEEKNLLNKDLEATNDAAGLEKLKEDAELLGHEDIVAQAQEKINAINSQAESIQALATAKIENAEERGGNSAELATQIAPIQAEIKQVQETTEQEVKVVQEQPSEKTTEDFSIRNPHEDVLGGILDISKLIQEGNRDKVPYSDEQIKDFAEKALDEAAEEDAKKPGDDNHYLGYLDRIIKGGIDIDKDKVRKHMEGIVQNYIKDRIETQNGIPNAVISNNDSVKELYGKYLDYVEVDKNRDWEEENNQESKKEYTLEDIQQQFAEKFGDNAFLRKGNRVERFALIEELKARAKDPEEVQKMISQIVDDQKDAFVKKNSFAAKLLMQRTNNDPSSDQINSMFNEINREYGYDIDPYSVTSKLWESTGQY